MTCSSVLVLALIVGPVIPAFAADSAQPVRMGCGMMTFDTVPAGCPRATIADAFRRTRDTSIADKFFATINIDTKPISANEVVLLTL